ncbi:MAG TPA: SpoIIE family protein phosphatase, partial [Polyangiaceae bacterium]|nr:SpoIIE family protein phosphatase [Polyangiaceae bacterium]
MTEPALRFELAVRARPCAGEFVNGDLVCWKLAGASTFVLVLDAAGHGREARRVAELAEDAFGAAHLDDPAAFLYALDEKLRGGRGAAAALARLDSSERRLHYAAVGNISARVVGHGETHLASRDGTLGQHF